MFCAYFMHDQVLRLLKISCKTKPDYIMIKKGLLIVTCFLICFASIGQRVGSSPEYIKALTSEWKGERFPDGRPKVSDAILERLKNISMEEARSEERRVGKECRSRWSPYN